MKSRFRKLISLLCVVGFALGQTNIVYAEEGIINIQKDNSTSPQVTIEFDQPTQPESSLDSSIIDIAVDGSSDVVMDETLENATSLTTEINVEVPASVHVDPNATINNGVYADTINLSGMTYLQAKEAVEEYIQALRNKQITLTSINGRTTTVSAGDLGIKWSNSDVLTDALGLGKQGNIIARYKANKDLEVEHKVYDVQIEADKSYVKNVVQIESDECGSDAKDATMTRENGQFVITEGQEGFGIDVDASADKVMSEMTSWNKQDATYELVSGMIEPKGTAEELSKVKDLLGSFTTSFSSSGKERSGNVRNGTKLLNGKLLYPGEQLSVYENVSPFSEENGYYLAGSYSNGLVVETFGGGICQVSSTLYNAVIRAELQVDERSNHSMIVTYVDMSADAAISGTAKDFKFTNNLSNPIFIEGYTTEDKQVVFNIYGVETRPSNRTLSFQSVELERTEPEGEKVVADSSEPVGSISVQSAHTGYVGEYWKIVKEDGVEVDRVQLNKSKYQAVPKTATVGTAADDPAISEAVKAAIATGSIDYCKETIAQLKSAAEAASALTQVPVVPQTTDAVTPDSSTTSQPAQESNSTQESSQQQESAPASNSGGTDVTPVDVGEI